MAGCSTPFIVLKTENQGHTQELLSHCMWTTYVPIFYYVLVFYTIELKKFPTLFCCVENRESWWLAYQWDVKSCILFSKLLLLFLEISISLFIAYCVSNITLTDYKKSKDPGGLVLLESIFSFDLSVPLNYLLKGLEERVLIIQVKQWLIPYYLCNFSISSLILWKISNSSLSFIIQFFLVKRVEWEFELLNF